jgi:hypothetical protein
MSSPATAYRLSLRRDRQQCRDRRFPRRPGVPDCRRPEGPQRAILREGTYAINLAQFVIITRDQIYGLMLERADQQVFDQMSSLIASRSGFDAVVIKDAQDQIGVVTVHDGPALGAEEIIAPKSAPISRPQEHSITHSRTRKSSSPQAVVAGASFRFWSKAAITSTGCSRRSRWLPRP